MHSIWFGEKFWWLVVGNIHDLLMACSMSKLSVLLTVTSAGVQHAYALSAAHCNQCRRLKWGIILIQREMLLSMQLVARDKKMWIFSQFQWRMIDDDLGIQRRIAADFYLSEYDYRSYYRWNVPGMIEISPDWVRDRCILLGVNILCSCWLFLRRRSKLWQFMEVVGFGGTGGDMTSRRTQ